MFIMILDALTVYVGGVFVRNVSDIKDPLFVQKEYRDAGLVY